MNKLQFKQIITYFFCIICFTSCNKNQQNYPSLMLQADSLINNNPRKTLTLLESLQDSIRHMPEETQMYYNLLCIKAKDKSYITHTSDSIISQIVSFYESHEDQDKLMEAYYYMGRVSRDLKDAPRALEYFHKAIDVSGNTKKYDIVARIYSQMGTLYAFQDVYEEAIAMHEKSLQYQLLTKDSTLLEISMRNIARIYDMTEKKDTAIIYYLKAYDIANKTGCKENAVRILSELSGVYININMHDETFNCLYHTLNNALNQSQHFTYVGLGLLHLKTNKLDSAAFYLNKVLGCDNLYISSKVYNSLSIIEELRQNSKEALRYTRLYQQDMDSVSKITTSGEIRKVRSLYNYQKREKENQKLKLANTQKQLYIFRLALLIILIVFVFIIVLHSLRKRKNQLIEQAKRVQQEKESQYKQSLEYIEKNNIKLQEMERALSQMKEQKDTAQQNLIQTQKDLLEKTNQQVILQQEKLNILKSDFNISPIYLKFHALSNQDDPKISESDWELLQKELDITYENFIGRLYALFPQLSLVELRICCLIKTSIKVSRMAIFLNRSKSSISSSRSRLYKKLTGTEGNPEEFDDFIKKM